MDKYESLERKLHAIKKCLGEIEVNGIATKSYVANYERYVDNLIELVHNRKLRNSNGALLGLGRGLSDYDELCSHNELLKAAWEADNYYSTIVFDLATGEYKGNFEGSPKDFYWCETESGSRVALGFELNWTRIYRSGYDVWLRTHILWEHKWQDGKIYSIPQWFYLYQSQDIDDTIEQVEEYSNLDPELDAVQKYRLSTDKEGNLKPMLAGSSSGLSPEIIASLGKIKPLPTKLCLYAGVDCKDGTIVCAE